MGKGKRRKAATVEAVAPVAQRHGFDDGFLGHETAYAVNVNEGTALSIDTVFSCVTTIADLTADAMIGEYRGTTRIEPESRIVRRPMASVTRRTWVWQMAATMALYDGVYIRHRFGRDAEGVPMTLEPVAPVRVAWMGPRTVRVDGQEVHPDDLVWVPRTTFPTISRDLSSVLNLAREAFAAASAAGLYTSGFWEAGGAVDLYLKTDQELTGPEAEDIGTRWQDVRATNPGRPVVLGKGTEPKSLGTNLAAEGAMSATSKLGTSIARYFRVPAWMVNVPSEAGSLTYANAAQAGLDLVRYTLQPGYAGPISDAWSAELPGDYLVGRRVVMDLTHLTRGTILEQAQAYAIATGNKPWMGPDEVRDQLFMPGDARFSLSDAGAPAPALEMIGG